MYKKSKNIRVRSRGKTKGRKRHCDGVTCLMCRRVCTEKYRVLTYYKTVMRTRWTIEIKIAYIILICVSYRYWARQLLQFIYFSFTDIDRKASILWRLRIIKIHTVVLKNFWFYKTQRLETRVSKKKKKNLQKLIRTTIKKRKTSI